MRNIATTVNKIPRLVQFMREYITEQKFLQGDALLTNKEFVKNLFDYCGERIDMRYGPRDFILTDKILSAIVYGDNLKLDDEDTLSGILNSIFLIH